MRRFYASIWYRLIIGLVLGSIAAVLAAGVFLYIRFKDVDVESRERTLQGQAKIIANLYASSPRHNFQLPESVAPYYRNGAGEFVILGLDGTIFSGSPGVINGFHPIDPNEKREFFMQPHDDGQPSLYGISLKVPKSSPPVWVQVMFKDSEVIFDSVLEEFVQDIAWVWLPFVVILLVINLIVIKIGLNPLAKASAQASAIGPMSVSKRFSEEGMPEEVLTFVKSINHALDRLEFGYKEQQAFIADAAHELRTPIAIMTTHLDSLHSFNGKNALKEELEALKRLVNQLLDNARIDALQITREDRVDLNQLASDVAAYLAPRAIGLGKRIEVYHSERRVLINGVYDYLFRMLVNLVENGIEHTPIGTAVYIRIVRPSTLIVADCGPGIPQAAREVIFQRFWQGKRDRGTGAGLGMAIISRTVTAHGGQIRIEDWRHGGALFKIKFPPFRQILPTSQTALLTAQSSPEDLPPRQSSL